MSAVRPKVVYVMGSHHIGSTVLGVALGNCEDFFFAGEVHAWFTRHGVPAYRTPESLAFWRGVAEQVEHGAELFGHDTELYIDRSSALRIDRLRRWPTTRRELLPRYREATAELYRAIAATSGAGHIIDTSHYPLRASQLQSLPGIDLYLLFLVRDPQGVVASHDPTRAAEGAKSALTMNLHLWATHALALPVFLRQPPARRMFLRHEQFLAEPAIALGAILDWLGSDAALPDLTSLQTGFPLQGNPFLKDHHVIALKGPPARPAGSSPMTAVMQAPWTALFSHLGPAVAQRARPPQRP